MQFLVRGNTHTAAEYAKSFQDYQPPQEISIIFLSSSFLFTWLPICIETHLMDGTENM